MTDLNHVALFIQVVEAGSISEAARRLGTPKATVSRKIARLEADLATRLLHRTSRRLELTAQGRAYYEEAARAVVMLDGAGQKLTASQAEPSGALRLTAPVALGASGFVEWTAQFLARFPKVDVELRLTDDYLDLIAERIDLAFRIGPLQSSSLIARSLGPSRLAFAASPAYIERRGRPETLGELEEHDWVFFGRPLDQAAIRLEETEGAREIPVRCRLAVDGAYAAALAVRAGLGIALLPLPLVVAGEADGSLYRLLPDHERHSGGFFAVYPSSRHRSTASRAFLDFVVDKIRTTPPWMEA